MRWINLKTTFQLLVFLTMMAHAATVGAQGWRLTFGIGMGGAGNNGNNEVVCVAPMPDGSNVSVINNPGFGNNTAYYFAYTDPDRLTDNGANGYGTGHYDNFIARSMVTLAQNEIALLEERMPENGGQRTLALVRNFWPDPIANGNNITQLWAKDIFTAPNGADSYGNNLLRDGNQFAVLGHVSTLPGGTDFDVLLLLTDDDGNLLWSRTFPTPENDRGIRMAKASDGGYLLLVERNPDNDPLLTQQWLLKTDAAGNLLWETNLTGPGGNDLLTDLAQSATGDLIVTGVNRAAGDHPFLLKIDQSGNQLWRKDLSMPGVTCFYSHVVEDFNGDVVMAATVQLPTSDLADNVDVFLIKTDANGDPIWERNHGRADRYEHIHDLGLMANGGYIMGGALTLTSSPWSIALLIRTDVNGIALPSVIQGNVFADFDLDCGHTPGEAPLENWVVRAFQDSLRNYYADTDADGNYIIECDTGSYIVTLALASPLWAACDNDVPVSVGYLDSLHIDFAVQPEIECAYLDVDLQTATLRPCDTSTYHLRYCNFGTETAADALVELTLDPLLTFIASSVAPSANTGNTYTFPLGDVGVGECGSFTVDVVTDCAAQIGQVACSEAHIFPDDDCLPAGQSWEGAVIRATGECVGDQVIFTLENIGSDSTAAPLEYIVIEDAVLLMQGEFTLQPTETVAVPAVANGATYHLIAEQEPGAPGSEMEIAAVEGCVGSSGNQPSYGFVNQFPQADDAPFLSVLCREIRNSYDPNDKQAFPTGFGEEHNILANTDIEYLLRFQNTGNDTAFRVILLDTLSAHLDPMTVRPGASSHPYTFEVDAKGTLRFTFQGINLLPASVDSAASQGFVGFRIAQQKDNPVGTVIENRAGIYFDYNLPIITNTVWHTVHEPIFEVEILSQYDLQPVQISAYPNPFSEQLFVELPEGIPASQAELRLFSVAGQTMRTLKFDGQRLVVKREDLLAGNYFFTVTNAGKALASGKIIVK
ncbi:MAG: T9SS type A sorting domain-containing protein [Saprospiraceae bacterium]|nr:T9SS type A sorting domain-containing protein [Saprospiraceae bacterium]